MGQEKIVSKQAQANIKIASFNIPHTFLVGESSPDCVFKQRFSCKKGYKGRFKGEGTALESRRLNWYSKSARRNLQPRRRE